MPGRFHDKVVVISGGSRGIGRGIATAFAREGARRVLASSSAANLAVAAKAIAAEGPEPLTVAGDLRELSGCEQVFAQAKERFTAATSSSTTPGAPAPAISSIFRTRPLSTASRSNISPQSG